MGFFTAFDTCILSNCYIISNFFFKMIPSLFPTQHKEFSGF